MSGSIAFAKNASTSSSTPRSGHNPVVRSAFLAVCSAMLSITALAQTSSTYVQTNILSDGSVPAAQTDPTLINPWGVSVGPAIWINKAGSGSVAVDSAAGLPLLAPVTIASANAASTAAAAPAPTPDPTPTPAPAPDPYNPYRASVSSVGSPSGTVYNSNGSIFSIPGSSSALFLFSTLDGTIAAWNVSSGAQAVTVVNNSAAGASYTDIALDTNATGTFLLAANFRHGTVDVFNSSFAPATLAGKFTDPSLPTGYAPFGIHSIGGMVYVTYAQVNANGAETVGAGLGYVDEFDSNGNFIKEAITQSVLNAPWGMALAPAGFGSYGGDLLVGNFGDGVINVFNPTTFAFVGSLTNAQGSPVANPGLWEIFFGQGGNVGDPNTLYFAAGINNERDGLFGSIAVAQPGITAPNFSFTSTATSLTVVGGQAGSLSLSLAPTNGFSGPVTFTCSSTTITCTFNPATVTVSGSTPVTVGVALAETVPITAPVSNPTGYERSASNHSAPLLHSPAGLTLAFIGPVGLLTFAGLRRKSLLARGSFFALLLVAVAGISGCSSGQSAATMAAATPVMGQVTINATSGAITQSVTIAVTEQ